MQQLRPDSPAAYLTCHRNLGNVDFVTGEPINEKSTLTAPLAVPPYFVSSNYLFGLFPNIAPLILSQVLLLIIKNILIN